MKKYLFLGVALVLSLASSGFAEESLVIEKVWPEKLLYEPKENAELTVKVNNLTAQEQNGELKVLLISEFDQAREIYKDFFKVEANSNKTVSVKWNTGSEQYGFEARAVLSKDGKVVSSKSEYFGVSDNAFKIGQQSNGQGGYSQGEYYRKTLVPWARSNYIMVWEWHAWAPCLFSELTPESESWYSGFGHLQGFRASKKGIRTFVQEAHKHGIKMLTYSRCSGGPPHFEFARKYPEWALFNKFGRFDAFFDVGALDKAKKGEPAGTWCTLTGNFLDLKLVDFGCDEIIASSKMFGWDGVRFDGSFYIFNKTPEGPAYNIEGKLNPQDPEEMDKLNYRNIRRIKENLWKANPKFLIGENGACEEGFLGWIGAPIPKTVKEIPRGGCYILDEGFRGFEESGNPLNKWEAARQKALEFTKRVKNAGGYSYLGPIYYLDLGGHPKKFNVKIWTAHTLSLTFATGAKVWVAYRGGAPGLADFRPYFSFATRYSSFIYDDALKVISPADYNINVESKNKLWEWKDFVCERTHSTTLRVRPGKRLNQVIVHLLNPPVHLEVDKDEKEAPEIQKDIILSMDIPKDVKFKRAFLLSPDLQPWDSTLNPKLEGNKLIVSVPELRFWDIVVVEME